MACVAVSAATVKTDRWAYICRSLPSKRIHVHAYSVCTRYLLTRPRCFEEGRTRHPIDYDRRATRAAVFIPTRAGVA